MQKHKIILIGSGQLGTRHLQAIASLKEISDIAIVDPIETSLELGKKRLTEINDLNQNIKFSWASDIEQVKGEFSLCLVATQAGSRLDIIKKVVQTCKVDKFFIEKIVTQSSQDYLQLLDLAKKNNLKVWVNCKTRGYGIHQYIKSKLVSSEPISFIDCGGNHGLANNGVHSADLFVFYDNCKKIDLSIARIEDKLIPSKRGTAIFDLAGALYGKTIKGSEYILSYRSFSDSPNLITIMTPSCRFIVDHFEKFAFESYSSDKWQWKKIDINENWSVSFMSKAFVKDILTKADCLLPSLEESFPAHEFILNSLQPEFNKLLGKQLDYCPVT